MNFSHLCKTVIYERLAGYRFHDLHQVEVETTGVPTTELFLSYQTRYDFLALQEGCLTEITTVLRTERPYDRYDPERWSFYRWIIAVNDRKQKAQQKQYEWKIENKPRYQPRTFINGA